MFPKLTYINENDAPYIYQAKSLRILYNCITNSDDKQMIKYVVQKILNLNYILYLITKKEIFVKSTKKSFLHTILLDEVLKLLNEVWLNSDKPPIALFNNKDVLKFLKKSVSLIQNFDRYFPFAIFFFYVI